MSNGLLRRLLAIQSFILGCGILLFLLFFGHGGGSAIETLKAIGVLLGLAIYAGISLRVVTLLKSPDPASRNSAIGTLLCFPAIAWLAVAILTGQGA
jgi:hypothetical protein